MISTPDMHRSLLTPRHVGAGALLSLSLLASAPAHAQAAAAQVLFEQGRAALAAGDLATACARFRASDEIDAGAGVRVNLAICEERRGHLASAWEAFRGALAKMGPDDERRVRVERALAALEPRLPRLVLTLDPSAPRETTVSEGKVPVGMTSTFGIPLPFDPGLHHLTVTAPGRAPRTVDVTLTEGQTTTRVVAPLDAPAGDAAAASPGPWIVGGAGLAALIAGGVTGALVLQKKSVTDANCNATSCNATGESAASAGRTLGPVTTVCLVAGGAALAAGGIWLGVRGKAAASARVGVSFTPAGAAWRIEGAW
jgi:hypothetical protein